MLKLIQTKKTTLSYGINDSATTIRLTNLLKLSGASMAASDLGDLLYGTFDPGTSREEIFSIDGANATVNADGTIDITSVVRGLKEVDPYDTGGFATDHPAGAIVVFGNNPQIYKTLQRVLKRVTGTTSSATPTPNCDTTDIYALTALAEAAAFVNPTGTPTNGQPLIIRIKSDATPRALTWGTDYIAGGTALPTTTVASKITTVGFIYNTDNALNKWMCVAYGQEV